MDCHHTTIDRESAKLAHNLPAVMLSEIRLAVTSPDGDDTWHDLLPGPAVNQQDIQCAVCHREHKGSKGELLAISDAKCQSCHQDRYGRFADSHPDWKQWPYGRGGEIAFNHATHRNKHFPSDPARLRVGAVSVQ